MTQFQIISQKEISCPRCDKAILARFLKKHLETTHKLNSHEIKAIFTERKHSKILALDREAIEQLRKSKELQGALVPIMKDQYGNIISGRHRKQVDPNWPETTVEVKDELDRELKIIHYNVQRKPSRKETQKRLLRIAKILKAQCIAKENITAEVAKLVPYSDRYVRELLPDDYKQEAKVRFVEVAPQTNKHEASKKDEQVRVAESQKEVLPQADNTTLYRIILETLKKQQLCCPVHHSGTLVWSCCNKPLFGSG